MPLNERWSALEWGSNRSKRKYSSSSRMLSANQAARLFSLTLHPTDGLTFEASPTATGKIGQPVDVEKCWGQAPIVLDRSGLDFLTARRFTIAPLADQSRDLEHRKSI